MIMIYTCMLAAHLTLMTVIYQQSRAFKFAVLPTPRVLAIATIIAIILNAICLGYALANVLIQCYITIVLGE